LRERRDTDSTILPVVFGGDDVTVVCHARFALDIARRFLLAFEEQTAVQPALRAIAGKPLTGSAGIAYVKPHHPFSAAYALAEELTASAKTVKRLAGREVSAVDFHVAFESTLADLATLRRQTSADGLPRHGGPYVVNAQDSPPPDPRHIAELDLTMATLSKLSSSMAHDLREGLATGRAEFERRLDLAALSPDRPDGVEPEDIRHLAPLPAGGDGAPGDGRSSPGDGPIVRLLDALLLNAITGQPPLAPPGSSGEPDSVAAGVTQ
jgi:hypothetical protein